MKLNPATRTFWIRHAEQTLWAGLFAAVSTVTVDNLPWHLPTWVIPIAATALATVKGFIARHVGDSQDPATLPAGV